MRVYVCSSHRATNPDALVAVSREDSSYPVRLAAGLVALPANRRVELENLRVLLRVVETKSLLEIAGAITPEDKAIRGNLKASLDQVTRGEEIVERIAAFDALRRLDATQSLHCERFLQSILLGWDPPARIEAALAFRKPSPASIAILTHRRKVEREPDARAAIDRALGEAKPR